MMDIIKVQFQLVYKFFDKKTSGSYTSGGAVKSEIVENTELAEELHRSIIRIFKKPKTH